MTKEKIAVIDYGKLGAPLIVCFKQAGHPVVGINTEILKSLIPQNCKYSG
jgi:UDP-N-acetyl-D-mannosaminuronate dehydrogenase